MEKNLDLIAKELFGKIRTQFPKIQLGDADSKVTDRPQDARFFEFDYVKDDKNLGTISVSLSEDDGLVILYSNDIVDNQHDVVKKQWFRFLRGMRDFAKARLLNFSIRDIAKTNLDKRDYKFLSNNSGEPAMTESKLWGTSKTSFQNMGEAKLIVKHSKPVNYDLPAGRTMHIESIFIENTEGERFRYPYKHLNGARALATHVAAGGTSYDDIGQHIIGLSEELNKLRMFKGYVDRHPVIAEAMDSINSKVFERIDQIKKEISGLQRPAYYQAFAENFKKRDEVLIPEDVVNDWVDRLTIRNFNEELKNVFPYIYNLVGENVAPIVELTPEDIVASQQTQVGSEIETELSELSDFESYLEQLVKEDNDIFNNDETQSDAINKLNQLMSSEMPAGTDGTNAIQSLKGIIDDQELSDALQSLGKINPEGDVRSTVKQYLEAKDKENGTDIASKITYTSDSAPQPTPPQEEPAPTAEAPPSEPVAAPPEATAAAPAEQPAPVAESKLAKAIQKAKAAGATAETVVNFGFGEMSLGEAISKAGLSLSDYFAEAVVNKKAQEVVEFVKSMYDETTGHFPKGETGVLISVEKEFGEDAADIARQVIGELSTVYESKRLRQLAGITETGLQQPGLDVATMFKNLNARLR